MSATSNLTMAELIDIAYHKIGITVNTALQTRAQTLLNLIIREEDAKQTGNNKSLWALSYAGLFLTNDGFIYSVNEGLEDQVMELVHVAYRDSNGKDTTIKIIDTQGYAEIREKDTNGDPERVMLSQDNDYQYRQLYVHPAINSGVVSSEVIGSDGFNYSCVLGHTASSSNYPITGASWKLYWAQLGTNGIAWVGDTAYVNGPLLRYVYKRPLYDFSAEDDYADMPRAWIRYLVYRLAHDLCPDNDIDMESRTWLRGEYMVAYNDLFNSAAPVTTEIHNKVVYF